MLFSGDLFESANEGLVWGDSLGKHLKLELLVL